MTGPTVRAPLRFVLLAVAAGMAWWLLGFLPWLADGLLSSAPTGGPFAPDQGMASTTMAVPLVAEDLVELVTMATLGAVAAGVLVRVGGARRPPSVVAVCVGVAAAAATALAQSRHAASSVSGQFASDSRVLSALVLVVLGSTGVGLLAGFVAGLGPAWGRTLALAAPVVLLPGWLQELIPGDQPALSRWVFAAAMAALLGLSTTEVADVAAWVPAVAIAWATQTALPALVVISSTIQPGYGLDSHPWYPLEVGRDVFRAALTTPEAHWPTAWTCALVAAAAISLGRAGSRQRGARRSGTGGGAVLRRGPT